MEAVADLAKKYDLMVVSDELYGALLFDGTVRTSVASLPGMAERTITVGGVSDVYKRQAQSIAGGDSQPMHS